MARYEENGFVYIRYEFETYSPGRIVLASCENIDVLEETIDGKNTFHSTQMMLWQRGPARKRCNIDMKIGRAKTVPRVSLEKFHKLDYACHPVGGCPNPVFHPSLEIKVKTWFTESEDQVDARLKNLAWTLVQMHDIFHQNVPAWSAFNARISSVNPPIAAPGMLLILQTPADDNNTMVTLSNRFMDITDRLGQPDTVIALDQPLYSTGKEIIWANHEKYKNVVLVMGHLHILFNFLKTIGQHMENAGLADVWVESGMFAQNSTDAMIGGKAHYGVVRGHILAYETLSPICWDHFTRWLRANGRERNLKPVVEKVVEQFIKKESESKEAVESVSNLVNTLKQIGIMELTDEFDQGMAHVGNFVLRRTYMRMVEKMIDFIRTNQDGNWSLHLNSFASMLPWMTIYDHINHARWGTIYLSEMKGLEASQSLVYEEFMNGNFAVKRGKARFNQIPIDQAREWLNKVYKI